MFGTLGYETFVLFGGINHHLLVLGDHSLKFMKFSFGSSSVILRESF